VISCAIATAIAIPLDSPSSFFFLAVMVSSLYGGKGPGVLSALLSSLAFDYFFLPPRYSFTMQPFSSLQFSVFLGAIIVVSVLIEAKRRAEEARRQIDVKYQQVSADALAETRKSEARLRLIIDSIPVPAWSSRPLCRHQSSAPPGFSGDPFTFTSRRGRGDCIHPQAPDPRIDHRGRPQGGPLVGSVGCNTRDADECHSHADYAQQGAPIRIALFDDRIEIENPGLLPFGLTIEDIMQGISKLRNRVIGRVFHELHLIEQWGSGIQRMTAACQEAGLEAPRLEEIGMHFRVTIPSARVRQPHTDETDRHILTLFGDGVARSTAAVAKHIGLSQRATLARLKSLASRGLVVEIGTGPHDPKRQYVIA
jgi:hypothetical protein